MDDQHHLTTKEVTYSDSNQTETETILRIQRDLAICLANTTGFDQGIHSCISMLKSLTGIDCAGFYLLNDEYNLELRAQQGFPPALLEKISSFPLDSPQTRLTLKGKPVYTQYLKLNSTDTVQTETGLRAMALLPILHQGKPVGSLIVSSQTLKDIPKTTQILLEWMIAHFENAFARLLRESMWTEQEKAYKLFEENIEDIVISLSPEGIILSVTPNALAFSGYTVKEIVNSHFSIFFTDANELAKAKIYFAEILSQQNTVVFEFRLKAKNREPFPIEIKAKPILKKGEVVAIEVVARNISERKFAELSLQEEQDFSQALIETSQAIILVLDYDGRIILYNTYFEDLSGYKLEDVRGKEWFRIFSPAHDQNNMQRIFKEILTRDVIHHTINPVTTKDGELRLIEWHNKTLRDAHGSIQGVLLFGRDVTEHKQFETLLKIQRDIAIAFGTEKNLQQALQIALNSLLKINEIDCGSIYLVNDFLKNFTIFVQINLPPTFTKSIQQFSEDCFFSRLAGSRTPIYYNLKELSHAPFALPKDENFQALAIVPVVFEDKVIACLMLMSKTSAVLPAMVRNSLESIAAQIGGAIARAKSIEAMHESEARHRAIFESSTDAIMLLDKEGFFDCNQATLDVFGLSKKEEFIGIHPSKLSPPQQPDGEDSLSAANKRIMEAFNYGSTKFKWIYRRKNGEEFPAEVKLATFSMQDRQVLQATVRDITEQVYTQKHQQKSLEIQAALNDLISLSLDAVFLKEIFSKIIYQLMSIPWLDSVTQCAIFLTDKQTRSLQLQCQRGWSAKQLGEYASIPLQSLGEDLLVESAHSVVINPDLHCLEHFRSSPQEILLLLPLVDAYQHLLGMIILTSTRTRPLDNIEEAFFHTAQQMIISLIQRKQSEEKFQAAYTRMDHLVNSIPTILIAIDKNNIITQWNPAAEKIFGISITQAIGKSLLDCGIPWEWRKALKHIPNILRQYKPLKFENIRFTRPDQKEGFLDLTVTPIRGTIDQFSEFLLVGVDRTEQKSLEMQLLQSQKLESIGQLAAGIAHEINTPTQYVGDNIRFLQQSFGDLFQLLEEFKLLLEAAKNNQLSQKVITKVEKAIEQTDLEYLFREIPNAVSQSLEGVERVATIVRAMKGFAHPDASQEKVLVNINQGIENTITVARNEWKYVAELETHLDPTLPLVPCQPGEINQVILNIIVNAAHAIGDVLGERPATKGKITVCTKQDNNWVEIRISDTGKGIPPNIQNKIYDPFFTTKNVGKGTGQGLAISRSVIVDKHKGTINFESELGKGTTFIIRLPINEQKELCEQ